MIDLLIDNGKVVYPDVTLDAAVAIDDGKIVAVGSSSMMPRAEKIIDAGEKFVIPGGVDPHVHIRSPFMGATTNDDFYTGTMAGASGGTTTVIDFAIQSKGSLPMEAIKNRRAEADGKVVIDYSLHSAITDPTDKTINQIEEIIHYGIPSFKLFMVYREEGLMVDDGTIMTIFEETKDKKGLAGFHSENVAIIEYLVDKALREGNTGAIYHALTRPNVSEAEAISRILFLAKSLDAPIYDFHMSIKEGVNLFRQARSKGQPVYCETCTHYLILTKEKMKGPDGINYICSPPLREREDVEALWKGIADGTVSLVASDQAAFTAEHKKLGKESFDKVPNGLPGIEFRLPLVFSEGVQKGRINVNKFVEVTSTNAAKIFGLYPKKGILYVGSDADLVILDPKLKKTITTEESTYGMDWYPYEGMKVKGYPVTTISKGKLIYEEGEFKGEAGDGEFLKRSLTPDLFKRPIV